MFELFLHRKREIAFFLHEVTFFKKKLFFGLFFFTARSCKLNRYVYLGFTASSFRESNTHKEMSSFSPPSVQRKKDTIVNS